MDEWIKRVDRKPDDPGMYLVAGGKYSGAEFETFTPVVGAAWWDGKRFILPKQADYFSVKHWMPLPAPPEASNG